MRTQIYCNDEYFNISFFGIDFTKVKRLLEYINVDSVSILRDESYQYIFDNHTLIDDFIDYASNINASIIIFDGMVESCLMDKELNILMNRKILVDINLGENTVAKMLVQQEYCGDVINFKTYSKSFRNKKRIQNPEENWAIFKDVHEPIIDRETFDIVQAYISNTKRRAPKKKNGEKNMFADLLYCADCGSKLWYNVNHPNTDIQYFNCSNYKGARGTCTSTHYIRVDSIEQVVLAELQSVAQYLLEEEEDFAAILEEKTNSDIGAEQKRLKADLASSSARLKELERLYERVYEDNVNGKVTDDWFMKLTHKYETETEQTQKKIISMQNDFANLEEKRG